MKLNQLKDALKPYHARPVVVRLIRKLKQETTERGRVSKTAKKYTDQVSK